VLDAVLQALLVDEHFAIMRIRPIIHEKVQETDKNNIIALSQARPIARMSRVITQPSHIFSIWGKLEIMLMQELEDGSFRLVCRYSRFW
jgi:hypothetical protein